MGHLRGSTDALFNQNILILIYSHLEPGQLSQSGDWATG